jgi:hypothetical protein
MRNSKRIGIPAEEAIAQEKFESEFNALYAGMADVLA